ncbi:hypothetical protein Q7P37_004111 [Cladosporium fusiforme]
MPPERRQGGRAQRACAYCRKRKMKCTGERPRCKNCEIYDQECIVVTASRRARPTNAAIKELREENRRLREQSSHERSESIDISSQGDISPGQDAVQPVDNAMTPSSMEIPPSDPPLQSTTLAGTPRSLAGASTYHGPTSTLFDDAMPANQQSRSWLSKEREAWMPRLLVAAAAEQRQYETINARDGKLDFDGVDPELGLHLLYLHWNRQHHSFLVTYRPAFMRDMACNGPYFSKILLNAIYYGASKFSPRLELRKDPDDVRTAGWQFRNRVRDLLGQALDHSEITTIQALLQMSNSLFALGDEQSAAWVYAGTAFRMLVDLGLHVDATMLPMMHRLSEEDLEIRRRVYWAAFVVDKMQSLYQGRPASLRALDGQVPIMFMDTYEELEQWNPFAYTAGSSYPGSPSYSVSTFKEFCKLCIILHDVLDRMYCEGKEKRSTESLIQDLDTLEMRMHDWRTNLPAHLIIDFSDSNSTKHVPPPHVFSLQATWNTLRILLHRPLVADGHLHQTFPSTSKSSFAACTEAAMNIVKLVRLYDKYFSVKRAPYLISYATYVAATIHVRIAAIRTSTSEAHEHLRTCLSVFNHNSATNHAVRKASVVIEALMKRMGVTVDNPNTNRPSSPRPESANQPGVADKSPQPRTGSFAQQGGLEPLRPQSEVGSLINPEPTMVAGQFVPGLDVDAIIHSFMQEQQLQGPNQPYVSGPVDHAANSYNNDLSSHDQGPLLNGEFGMFDDALFGFNASAFDWYYPTVMPNEH